MKKIFLSTLMIALFFKSSLFPLDAQETPYVELKGHANWVHSVAWSPDGRTLASGSLDGTIRLWDANTGEEIRTLDLHTAQFWGVQVFSVAWSPDGRTLASADSDGTIRLWDANTGEEIRTLEGESVFSVVFSPDGRTLASGSLDGTIRLWDAATGNHIRTLEGNPDGGENFVEFIDVNSVAFSPDGTTLASGSSDGTIRLWDAEAASATTNAILRLSPTPVHHAFAGEKLTFSLNITDGENVAGYQATVEYDTSALRYVESANSDYLPAGAFFVPPAPDVHRGIVILAATSLSGQSQGDGTLATVTFEVVAVKPSTVRLTDVLLTDSAGGSVVPQVAHAEITEPLTFPEDINRDGVVNIIDLVLVASNFGLTGGNVADVNGDRIVNIVDLTLVAGAFGNAAAAPEIWHLSVETGITRAQIAQWVSEAQQLNLTDTTFQRGRRILEQLLAVLTPQETALLPNYPNPFNPETWIPYQLSEAGDVVVSIYSVNGTLIRTLNLGHQPVGIYASRSRAAYWDGRNQLGEPVASGVYLYTLTTGNFAATRKMLIRK